MEFLLGKNKLNELKRDNPKLVLLCVLPTLAYIGAMVALFLTSSRKVMNFYPLVLAFVSTIYASFLVFYFAIILKNHISLKKLCYGAMSKRQFEMDVVVTSIAEKLTTVRGVTFYGVLIRELDDDNEQMVFILPEYISKFEVDKKYKMRVLQLILTAYEEIDDGQSK